MSTETKNQLVEKIAFKYGILMAASLTAFFLLMKLIGWAEILELRILNIFILAYFLWMALKDYLHKHQDNITYFKGFGLGILTGAFGALFFSLFIFIYISLLDPDFLDYIKTHQAFGEYLNPYLISVTIFLEGTASGFLVSYGFMQYYKRSHLVDPLEE